MSQRNSQNPIRKETSFKRERSRYIRGVAKQDGKVRGAIPCPSCGADVPPKPGFRMRSLKCPKCGAPVHK